MAFSETQVANAVAYFTSKNTARAAFLRNPSMGLSAATAAASRAAQGEQQRQQALDASFALNPGGRAFAEDVFAPMDEAETPTNATQWILNLLFTGGYATANVGRELGAAVEQGDVGKGLAAVPVGIAQGVAEGAGFRLDRDGDGQQERPRTWGQNWEDIGLNDTIRQGVAGIGGDEGWQDFAVGGAGLAGDIFLDPLTYVAGTGLLRGIRAGTGALGDSVRGGANPAQAILDAGRASAAAASAARAEVRAARASRSAARADRRAFNRGGGVPASGNVIGDTAPAAPASALSGAGSAEDVLTVEEMLTRVGLGGVRETEALRPLPEGFAWARVDDAAPGAVHPVRFTGAGRAGTLADGTPVEATRLPSASARRTGADLVLDLSPGARLGQTDRLLPSLRGARAVDVDVDQILSTAARPTRLGEVLPGTAQSLRALARESTKTSEVRRVLADATKSDPGATKWLRETRVRDNASGKEMSLAAAIEHVAVLRAAGYPASRVDPMIAKIDAALAAAAAVPRQTTPASLLDAVSMVRPGWEVSAPGATPTTDLLERFGRARTQDERRAILQSMLGVEKVSYRSFDDAMLGAINGEVDAELMREMLKALGIRSTITDPNAMRKALAGQGAMNWAAIKAGLRSPAEVFTDHGVDAAVAQAAVHIDLDAAIAAERVAYTRTVVDELGFDPALIRPPKLNADGTPRAGAGVGEATHMAIEAMGGLLRGVERAEAYGQTMLRAVHKSIMQTLRLRGRNVTGAARGANFAEDAIRATVATERYARSLGIMPRLSGRGAPVYVSFGQVMETLPREVLEASLFRPYRYRLGDKVADPAYKSGLSIYPTTIADGARAAIAGGDEALVRAVMEGSAARNAFQRSAEGQRAVDDLVRAMTSPGFLQPLRALHDSQGAVAARLAQGVADDVLEPLGARIVAALARNSDRSEVTTAVRDAYNGVQRQTAGLDAQPTLAHDLATARLDNALVNGVLGEHGVALARMDAQVRRNVLEQGTRPTPGRVRADGMRAMRDAGNDLAPGAVRALEDESAAWRLEDVDRELIPSMSEMDQGLGLLAVFSKIGRATEGTYGQEFLKTLQVRATSGLNNFSQEYRKAVSGWLRGTRGHPGVQQRLAEDLGVPPGSLTDDVLNSHMSEWWRSLAVITSRHPNIPEDELLGALQRGMPLDPSSGIPAAAAKLSRPQAEMAIEMHRYINEVFAPNGGPFARIGVTADDLIAQLDRYGFGEGGIFAGMKPKSGAALAGQEAIWRTFVDIDAPLDLLIGYHKAMTAAATRPSITASLSSLYGHSAAGLTAKEAAEQGWKRIDTTKGSLARHIDPEDYYPPEIRKQLAYLQHALDMLDKELPSMMRLVVGPYDAITGVWKSSTTIWNPAHHATNVMGEFLMLAMAGIPPMQALRSTRAMVKLGRLNARLEPLERYRALYDENVLAEAASRGRAIPASGGRTIAPRYSDDSAQVSIKGQGVTTLSPEQIWQYARNNGVAVTARESKDMLPGQAENIMGSRWAAFTRHPANVIATVDRGLGGFSAIRDNTTRLAHFYAALESKQFSSIDEAINYASAQVHSYHPTIQTLSASDQKYARRLIAFHTWVRQAAGRILATAVDRPGMVTIPSKWQYNQAEARGLEPESIGKPIPNDPRIASYLQQGVYGPSWLGGYSPFGGTDDLEDGEAPHLWGASMNAPQLDALYTLFGGVNFDQDPVRGTLWKLAGMGNPIIKAPAEYITDTKMGINSSSSVSDDYGLWLLNQTGAPGRIANAFGVMGTEQDSWTPEQIKGDTSRKLLNYLLGIKLTDYTNPTSQRIASLETAEWEKETLRGLGYTDAEIKAIREYWKDYRATNP